MVPFGPLRAGSPSRNFSTAPMSAIAMRSVTWLMLACISSCTAFGMRDERAHPALLVAILEAHLAAPVPEVRHRAVVADGRDLARHVEQLLAQAPDVHQDDDGGKRPALLRMGDEGVHPAVGGRDVDELLDHCSLMSALLTIGTPDAPFPGSSVRSGARAGRRASRAPSAANCFFASSVLRNASRMRFILVDDLRRHAGRRGERRERARSPCRRRRSRARSERRAGNRPARSEVTAMHLGRLHLRDVGRQPGLDLAAEHRR